MKIKKSRWFTVLFLIIGVSLLLNQGRVNLINAQSAKSAPSFALSDIYGKPFSSESLKGKVVILDFWATWCPPCRAEIPHFMSLYNQYKGQGLEIVGVAMDQGGVRVVKPFAEDFGMNYPVLIGNQEVAYANGANDNFKGVATLFGSGTTDYKKALWWSTLTTFLGSLTALFISTKLITAFSGKGLVPDAIASNPHFLISVGMGAALAVFIAAIIGIPISTTHSLVGALIGAGLFTTRAQINFQVLGNIFLLPLLLSPAISAFLTLVIYPCFKFARIKLGIEREMCLCVGENVEPVCIQGDGTAVLKSSGLAITVDQLKNCQQYYQGKILGFDSQYILDKLHYLSSGAVSFARGLNDTPKIIALLLVMSAFSFPAFGGIPLWREKWGIFIVASAMAVGGLLSAKKVAFTMSQRITKMNHGQGFSANLVTAILVIFASKWGMPVSTTYVSCGSLFGIGLVNKKANLSVIKQIILSWVLTLPLAAILSAGSFLVLNYIK